MGGGDILSFPSLALSRSGSEGISHPRIALRLAGPLAFATLRQPDDYNRALNFYQHILLSLKTVRDQVGLTALFVKEIMMDRLDEYPYEIRPLTTDEGGGFLIRYTDFWGCISDGETVKEAILNGGEALKATIAALHLEKLPVPAPNSRSQE
jgi:antitoxin HicB